MGWFGFLIVNALIIAVATAVVYIIYNIIYKIADTIRGCAVISFILNVFAIIMFIVDKSKPSIVDGRLSNSMVAILAVTGIALALSAVCLFVHSNDGDDVFAGIGASAGSAIAVMTVASIIQFFAKSYWPVYVVMILSIGVCVLTWLQNDY